MFSITGLIIACLIHHSAHGLPDTQIVGGTDAPDGQYPYQVSLKHLTGEHFCGGAIISKRYIITAAQCLNFKSPPEILIATGSNYLKAPYITYEADTFILHPAYNNSVHANDIGLIRMSKDINFNQNTQPIPLVSDDRDFDGVYLIATGWGRLWTNGSFPDRLQQITVQGYSQKMCNNMYKNITDNHLCALGGWGKGTCNGDSGSPLTDGKSLVGLVSFDKISCAEGVPDVYTRVYYYKPWIDEHVNAGSIQQSNIILGLFMAYLCIHSFL